MIKRSAIVSLAALLVAGVGPAVAGTKYLSNIVPLSTGTPTLSNKSKVLFKEQGILKAKLKGVMAPGAVTTDGSFKDGILTGDEYVVVVTGVLPSVGIDFEINLIVELKNGTGSVKGDGSALFSLIPGGLVRSVIITGTEVHGPLGVANVAACGTNLSASDGISFPPAPNPCAGGSFIGEAGIEVP